MDKQQLRKMIDACRPGGDDLRDPDLAALADHLARDEEAQAAYKKSQRLDAALGAAFRDAPVPADLEAKLLAAVAGSRAVADAVDAPSEHIRKDRTRVAESPKVQRRHTPSRRLVLGSLAAAAGIAAAVLIGLLVPYLNAPTEIGREQVVRHSQDWLDRLEDDPATWRELDEASFRHFPAYAVAAQPVVWRAMDTEFSARTRVFRLAGPQGRSAYLFAVPTKADLLGIGGAPPKDPFPGATGGWKIGAWRRDGVLFVLAVEGSKSDYRALVPSLPTA